MTTMQNHQTPGSHNKNAYCVNQFSFVRYFFMIIASIILLQYFLQTIWKYIDFRVVLELDCFQLAKSVTLSSSLSLVQIAEFSLF